MTPRRKPAFASPPSSPEREAQVEALQLARTAHARASNIAAIVGVEIPDPDDETLLASRAYRAGLVLAEVSFGVRAGTAADARAVKAARETLAPFAELANFDPRVDARLALGRGEVTADELAALGNVSVQYVRRLVAAGELGEAGEGGHHGGHRIPAREARRWLASRG